MYNKEYHRKISLMCQEIQQNCYNWHELKKNKTPSEKIQELLNTLNSYIKWLQVENHNYGKYINLSNINFYKYNFEHFILNNANLSNSKFTNCDFINSNLQKTILINAIFDDCKLIDVNLSEAKLKNIKPTKNKIKNIIFTNININDINFSLDENWVLNQLKFLTINDDNIHQVVKKLYINKKYKEIENLDVSEVTNMSCLFDNSIFKNFNLDLSNWNTSKVKNMSQMFINCTSFNRNLSEWDVSKVIDMDYMFYKCISFNGNISKWNVSNVESMDCMFYNCNIKEEFKPKFIKNLNEVIKNIF